MLSNPTAGSCFCFWIIYISYAHTQHKSQRTPCKRQRKEVSVTWTRTEINTLIEMKGVMNNVTKRSHNKIKAPFLQEHLTWPSSDHAPANNLSSNNENLSFHHQMPSSKRAARTFCIVCIPRMSLLHVFGLLISSGTAVCSSQMTAFVPS